MKSRNWFTGVVQKSCVFSLTRFFLALIHSLSFFSPTFIIFHSHLTFSLSHSHALSPISTRTNPFSLFVTCLQISALTVIIDTIQDYVIYICIYVYIYRTILNCIIWEKTRVNSSTADVGFRFVPLSLSRLFPSSSFYFFFKFHSFCSKLYLSFKILLSTLQTNDAFATSVPRIIFSRSIYFLIVAIKLQITREVLENLFLYYHIWCSIEDAYH